MAGHTKMAQSGFTPISIYYSATATNVPTAGNLVAGELAINTADGKLFYKDSAGVVQVIGTKGGVGSSSTTQVLYNSSGLVVGSAGLTFDGTNLATTGTATATRFIPSGSTVATNGLYLPAANSIGISTNSTNAVYIDSTQNVGIGTTSPAYPLNIVKNANGAQKVFFSNNSSGASAETAFSVYNGTAEASLRVAGSSYGGYGAYTANNTLVYNDTSAITIMADNASNGIIKFATGGNTERMRITSAGNVGIGTSSPSDKLHISNAGDLYIRVANTTTGITTYFGQPSTGTYIGNDGASPVLFYTNNAERMRIDSSGNVFINKTSTTANGKLEMSFSGNGYVSVNTDTGGTARNDIYFVRNGSNVGAIQTTSVATAYTSVSDYRLKENILPMTGALAKIFQLKPVIYKWKANGLNGQGFIAHELQAVIPDCVNGEKDAVDDEGKPVYQGIDTSFLVATLTAAIQEQQALIENLTKRLNALEGK